ncbi:hypothetical protein DFH08DRAFT_407650 [Mycena albidolilacea]|uniref:Uncharacterized protein n=1 Tax=Mycena albidolilacea TaxID=1033008 RepID=A0AAD7AHS7_9AGAR|nr:hypothetical protein DFH08DRAFT_407650 [Mycena albidolilacea]
MSYPRPTESADARAALMAMLPSQSPLELDSTPRIGTHYLQAERPSPYHVPTSACVSPSKPKSKRNSPPGKCRAARLGSSLGWGAFLKDETLRTLDGTVVRAAQTRTPVFTLPCPYAGDKLSQASMMRDCWFTERDAYASSPDRSVLFPSKNNASWDGVREDREMPSCGAFAKFDFDLYTPSPFDDPSMPAAPLPLWVPHEHDPLHLGARRDDVKAADEMFAMFIQLDELETCMEVD